MLATARWPHHYNKKKIVNTHQSGDWARPCMALLWPTVSSKVPLARLTEELLHSTRLSDRRAGERVESGQSMLSACEPYSKQSDHSLASYGQDSIESRPQRRYDNFANAVHSRQQTKAAENGTTQSESEPYKVILLTTRDPLTISTVSTRSLAFINDTLSF